MEMSFLYKDCCGALFFRQFVVVTIDVKSEICQPLQLG